MNNPMRVHKRKYMLLLGIIVLGAILIRLPFLDLYRFEHEMVRDIYHGERVLNGEVLLRGVYADIREDSPQQSFGPLMYYLIAGSLVLAPNEYWYPLMPSVLVMLLNLGAVVMCYRIGKEFFSPMVGLIAAALFAFSPWFVLHVSSYASNPNYLPFFVTLFVYGLCKVLVKREDKFLLPSFVALALATQIHLSSLMLFPFLLLSLMIFRRDIFAKKVLYISLLITAILYLPYLIYIIKTSSYGNLFAFAAARYPATFLAVLAESLGMPLIYPTPLLSSYLLGSVKVLPIVVYSATAMIVGMMVAAICYATYRVIKDGRKEKITAILLLWWLVPVLAYILIGKNVSPHFFIILLPVQFIIGAEVLHRVLSRRKKILLGVIGLVLAVYLIFTLTFYKVIDDKGGTDSLFGIPYKYRVQVVQEIAKDTTTPTIVYYGADKRNMNWLFAHFGLAPKYKYIQSLDELKEGYLIFDEYDFYSYSDKALPQEEKEKIKGEPGTEIKHMKIIRR